MSGFATAGLAHRTSWSVGFTGSRGASGPLAWGQQALWNAIRRTRPEDRYFNFARDFTPPQGREFGIDEVAAALCRVVERHEALRTTLTGGDERPVQTVAAAGRLDLAVLVCPPDAVDATTAGAVAEYEASTFDYFAEWPLRVAAVVTGTRVARVVFGFCHLAADFNASQIVLGDFERYLLDPAASLPDAPQPLDLAEYQHSVAGQRSSERALAHWEAEYRRIPATMFPAPVAPPQEPPYWTGSIVSAALGDAVALAARRYEVTSAAVILAACAGLAAQLGGHDLCAMLAIVANRFRPRQRDLVSSLSMEGLLTVDVDRGSSFSALARRTFSASADTYRYADYDETGRDAVFDRVSQDRGELIHPYCCYNDLRSEPDRVAPQDEPDLRAAMARTEFRWARMLPKVDCRFCLHIVGGPGLFRIDLTADTRYLPPDRIEGYLRAVELLLVEAAGRDVPLGELGEMLRRS
jgi:Condensation domain